MKKRRIKKPVYKAKAIPKSAEYEHAKKLFDKARNGMNAEILSAQEINQLAKEAVVLLAKENMQLNVAHWSKVVEYVKGF